MSLTINWNYGYEARLFRKKNMQKFPGRKRTTIVTTINRDVQRAKIKYPSFKVIPLISPVSLQNLYTKAKNRTLWRNTMKPVAPPGIFIGGQKCWGLGLCPRKFFFDHALYFDEYIKPNAQIATLKTACFSHFYNRKRWNVDCGALNSNPVIKRPHRKELSH